MGEELFILYIAGPAGLDADWYDPGLKRFPRVSACSAHTSSNTTFKLGRSIFFITVLNQGKKS